MKFAADHPHRVSALVLADSAGFGQEVALVLRLLTVRPLAALLMRPDKAASRRTVQSLFYDQELATDARVDHAFALSQRAVHRQTTLDIARDLGTIFGIRAEWRTALIDALAQSDRPTLVAWGDHDHILPHSQLGRRPRGCPAPSRTSSRTRGTCRRSNGLMSSPRWWRASWPGSGRAAGERRTSEREVFLPCDPVTTRCVQALETSAAFERMNS